MEEIEESLSIDNTNSYAYRNLAIIYLELGQTEKACKEIESAIQRGFTEKYGNEIIMLKAKHCK